MEQSSYTDLSRRERQLMDIIYRLGEASVADVLNNLPDPSGYNSVRVILTILENKGHLTHKREGKRYIYLPAELPERTKQTALKHLLTTFFEGSPSKILSALLDISASELSEAEYDELSNMIKLAKNDAHANRSTGETGHASDIDSFYPIGDIEIAFPERTKYVISPQAALEAIHEAIKQIKGYREQRLYIFENLIGPLVPENIRRFFSKFRLDKFSIDYSTLIDRAGKLISILVLFGLDERIDIVKENHRFIILPFIELKVRKKIENLEQTKPLGWKSECKFFQKYVDAITPIVDNMMNLVVLAWTFCPGIGEPEMTTGFYNRFVFTGNGGFIDLGHFFNCALIAYLYGEEEALKRGEATEVGQRFLREKKWLTKMQERHLLQIITNMLWGYATSTDTIEDRSSDKFGIMLGKHMRDTHHNGKAIDYFVEMFPKFIKRAMEPDKNETKISQIMNAIVMFLAKTFYRVKKGATVDIEKYMNDFFEEYDAIDPNDSSVVPKFLFQDVIEFYSDKYGGPDWNAYTNKEWQVIIPQDLWERVVRGRRRFGEKAMPIKIQLKDSGRLVEPYCENPSE